MIYKPCKINVPISPIPRGYFSLKENKSVCNKIQQVYIILE